MGVDLPDDADVAGFAGGSRRGDVVFFSSTLWLRNRWAWTRIETVDSALLQAAAMAEKVAHYRHAKLSPVRLAGEITRGPDEHPHPHFPFKAPLASPRWAALLIVRSLSPAWTTKCISPRKRQERLHLGDWVLTRQRVEASRFVMSLLFQVLLKLLRRPVDAGQLKCDLSQLIAGCLAQSGHKVLLPCRALSSSCGRVCSHTLWSANDFTSWS
jgi:hypothetical protein